MKDYNSLEELYKDLIPAFNVKIREIENTNYNYLTIEDIWKYLKISWASSSNLHICDMVQDILHVDVIDINNYKKGMR